MTASELPYQSASAFRQAVEARLKALAAERNASFNDLQRQFAYDRLLSRVFIHDPSLWVLKGATAMLARLKGRARHSKDVDLFNEGDDLESAERAFRSAAAEDIGDYFRFSLGGSERLADGIRIRVTAYLGTREFATFPVDLVVMRQMTAAPEEMDELVPLGIQGLRKARYRVYPLVDHIADKVCAMHEVHHRSVGLPEESTRYKDLVDLALFAHTVEVDAAALKLAVESEATRRSLSLPTAFREPDASTWPTGYAKAAAEVPELAERALGPAMELVRTFLDPILSGNAEGRWSPSDKLWRR